MLRASNPLLPPNPPNATTTAAQEASALRADAGRLQGALSSAQAEAREAQAEARALASELASFKGLSAQLEAAKWDAADATRRLEQLSASRSGELEAALDAAAAGAASADEAAALRSQQAALQAALGRAQDEARVLSAQLEATQRDADAANAMLATTQSQSEALEHAWRAAMEVRACRGRGMGDGWHGSSNAAAGGSL